MLDGIETADLLICEVRPYLSFENYTVNKVRMTFARLSNLYNFLVLHSTP